MKNYLAMAFSAGLGTVKSTPQRIVNVYDYAGFIAMRAYMDDTFLEIDPSKLASGHLRKVANVYNTVRETAQDKTFESIAQKHASGDFSPKPDFKKPLISLAKIAVTNMPKMTVGQIGVIALAAGVVWVSAHLGAHGHLSTALPESTANYLGSRTNGHSPSLNT